MNALERAIKAKGERGATTLAAELGVSVQRLFNWIGRRVPAEYCPLIERAVNGAVKCEELRPDIDWAYIRANGAKRLPKVVAA